MRGRRLETTAGCCVHYWKYESTHTKRKTISRRNKTKFVAPARHLVKEEQNQPKYKRRGSRKGAEWPNATPPKLAPTTAAATNGGEDECCHHTSSSDPKPGMLRSSYRYFVNTLVSYVYDSCA